MKCGLANADISKHINSSKNKNWNNITEGQQKALKTLKMDDSIIIKPTDKCNGMVLMNRTDYNAAGLEALQNETVYEQMSSDLNLNYQETSVRKITDMLNKGYISEVKDTKLREGNRTACFCGLPKVHKSLKILYCVQSAVVIIWPGSVHDAKAFASSAVNSKLQHGELPQTFFTALPGYEAIPTYLIADPAYPLKRFCMKEYQTCTENKQVIFNNMLRSARNQVGCAFGRLKARWGFMNRKVDLKFEIVPKVAYSCFVPHNYCEARKNCRLDDEEVQAQIMKHHEDDEHYLNTPDPVYSCNDEEGEYVRTVLPECIKQHLPENY